MGESTAFHTNCHKRFDSARLVNVYTYITTIESSMYKLIDMYINIYLVSDHILALTINYKTNGFLLQIYSLYLLL